MLINHDIKKDKSSTFNFIKRSQFKIGDAVFGNESELAFILQRAQNICGFIPQHHTQRKGKVP